MKSQKFIWSNENVTPIIFKVYKLTLAIYMVVACRYGFTDQKNFPKIYHSEFARDTVETKHDFSKFCIHRLYFQLG